MHTRRHILTYSFIEIWMANKSMQNPCQSPTLLFCSQSNSLPRSLLNEDSYHHYDLEVHRERSLKKEIPNMTIAINQNQTGKVKNPNQLQEQQVLRRTVFRGILRRRMITIMMNLLLLCCHLWESLHHPEGDFL